MNEELATLTSRTMRIRLFYTSLAALLAALVFFVPSGVVGVESATQVKTVVVVRHAEKKGGSGDVHLTPEGQQRAKRLAAMFRHADVDAVFSSLKARTHETVAPLAALHKLETQRIQDANNVVESLNELAPGSLAVVSHHSQSLGKILTGLGVAAAQVKALNFDTYDHLFLVVTHPKAPTRLLKLSY